MSSTVDRTSLLPNDPLTRRAALIFALVVLLLIPLAMVRGVIDERGARQQEVIAEMSMAWGGVQNVVGPILVIPFTERSKTQERWIDAQGDARSRERVSTHERQVLVLPQHLTQALSMEGSHRRRGIYQVLVHRSDLEARGHFELGDAVDLLGDDTTVHWDRVWLAFGISHPRSISEVSLTQVAGSDWPATPGTGISSILPSGFKVSFSLADDAMRPDNVVSFHIALAFHGVGPVNFAPLGARTQATVESTWAHPSFVGQTLPAEHEISDAGFSARWDIPQLARSYPQAWLGHREQPSVGGFLTGVELYEPVPVYQRVTRAVKYGVLFLLSTFLTLLTFEWFLERRLHLAQYALVGGSLTLFFLVLLSLAETIGFARAYLLAATTTIAMIASYAGAALRAWHLGVLLAALLGIAYSVLYGLLQLQDLALLMGTVVLLLGLALMMYLTRGLSR